LNRTRLCAALALFALVPSPASAWCRMTTSLRQPSLSEPCIFPDPSADPPEHYLEWRSRCSAIALSIAAPSAELTEEQVVEILGRSIIAWESVECSGVPFGIDIEILAAESTCTDVLYRDDGANVNTLLFVPDWTERDYDPAAFAVTTVWHRRSTGEILDVDMEVNEDRGPFGVCPAVGCLDDRVVDLQNVLTHELGHYLGLAHSTDPDATMYASAVAGETIKRDLSPDDVAGLCTIYPAGTPAGVCDFHPRGGLDLDCDTTCSVSAAGAPTGSAWLLAPIALALTLLRARARRSRS
jgi:hypothetical protein